MVDQATIAGRLQYWNVNPLPGGYNPDGSALGPDGHTYRTDCSGYVSMLCGLTGNPNTTELSVTCVPLLSRSMLKFGHLIVAVAGAGWDAGHVIMFDSWTDDTQTSYLGHEFGQGVAPVHHTIPYPYNPGDGRTFRPYAVPSVTYSGVPAAGTGQAATSLGLSSAQIGVAQTIYGAVARIAASLGLSAGDTQAAEVDAEEAALAESSLTNVGHGDAMGPDSIGVFQQMPSWGAARTDVAGATGLFLQGGQGGQAGLLQVTNWDKIPSWQAVQAVQQSEFADGSNYHDQYGRASQLVASLSAGGTPVATGTAGATNASYSNQPANWLADATGVTTLVKSAETTLLTFTLKGFFTVAGLGLVVMGVWRISAPVRSAAGQVASKIPAIPA